jgi:hypothetical protein
MEPLKAECLAYQFCLANDRLVKSDGIPGVIIEQPSGCFGLWERENGLHHIDQKLERHASKSRHQQSRMGRHRLSVSMRELSRHKSISTHDEREIRR